MDLLLCPGSLLSRVVVFQYVISGHLGIGMLVTACLHRQDNIAMVCQSPALKMHLDYQDTTRIEGQSKRPSSHMSCGCNELRDLLHHFRVWSLLHQVVATC